MKSVLSLCMVGITCLIPVIVRGQLPTNRVRPGTMYHEGDTVHSPRLGLNTIIPSGWEGVLPRESEVFLLMSNTLNGEIYAVVNEGIDKAGQVKRWMNGMEVSEGLRLLPDGDITNRGDAICANVKVTGNKPNNGDKIYLEGKCSPYGFCVSYMLTSDPGSYDKIRSAMQSLVDATQFSKPSTESPYVNFNWKKFLSGKVLLNIDYEQTSKREDQVSFCADGTFRSDITRKGVFKEQSKGYKGRKKGTWDVKSKGEKATLTFSFEKLAPVTVNMEIRNEQMYVNGKRYFIGNSEDCN
jgi:hypothetical protein